MMKVEGFYPDITGFIKKEHSTDIIVVEVKTNKPTIRNIFQAKNYAQIFNAEYALLVSTKTISEPKRRLILKRSEIISRYPYKQVVLTRFDKDTKKFDVNKELYYGSLPEPFKTYRKAFESENLIISDRKIKPIRVFVTNAGEVPVKIVKVKIDDSPSRVDVNVVLNPNDNKWIDLQKYVLWGMMHEPTKIELITELGKTFSHIK